MLVISLDLRVRLADREPPEGKTKKNRNDYSGSTVQLRVFKHCVNKFKSVNAFPTQSESI